ncbi:hypothetical protein B9Z55_013804 [Caenorhabditis nigoni]|uniref:CUB-like domain-containing protein n=1 Tax=Caenorhabditis nigoni TaxID=1611254 RepID=A0A2G5U3B4_9PELO|nr:hypothetical protein B9Z55_013804 [Caenorhabditis nigoni]
MLFLTLLALAAFSSASIVPLNTFQGETIYRVNKTHQIFVISDSPQEDLQALTISTQNSAQNSNAFTLSVASTDGSLTPFVPTQDNDMVSVTFTGATNNLKGYLYMNSVTPNLNVSPLFENKPINYKQGTNVFFKMSSPAGQIPVAQNVFVGNSEVLTGFVGLPEDVNPVQFFDSRFFNASTVITYDQLELPLDRFYFTSSSNRVKYEINYAARKNLTIGSSGLLMTNSFPNGGYETRDFDLKNQNGINVDAYFVPRFDTSRVPGYSGNITLFTTPENLGPIIFPMLSYSQSNITSNSPISRIVIESDGPYAIQYFLRDTTATTPSPVETTTKSSSFPQIVASLLMAAILRF